MSAPPPCEISPSALPDALGKKATDEAGKEIRFARSVLSKALGDTGRTPGQINSTWLENNL